MVSLPYKDRNKDIYILPLSDVPHLQDFTEFVVIVVALTISSDLK